ncbi:MAG: SymE family type I addiction module toxin, partial [Candidatus Thiodiazotropha sp.]
MARNDSTTPQWRSPKDKGCHTRKLMVNQIHYMRKLKDDPTGAGRPVPWIQLKGYWLNHAGFQINTPV